MSDVNGNTDKWMKISEWRGYTLKALEDIDDELKVIHIEIREIRKQNSQRDIKVATIAGTISLIVVIMGYIVPTMLGG